MSLGLVQTYTVGKSFNQWALQSSDCPLLKKFRILSLGYSRVGLGYNIARSKPAFSNLHMTTTGRGQAFIDGKWQTVQEGMSVLSPLGVPHAARSFTSTPWQFYWICFTEPDLPNSRIKVPNPTIVPIDPNPIHCLLKTLQGECQHLQQKTILDGILQVLDLYLQRILAPWYGEDRLWKLWEIVASAPAEPWTIERLAARANLSSRNLLRQCKKEQGRSLHQQLTHIRFTKAASLLQDKKLKLQTIAQFIGYNDAFAFSKAFKKWAGVSPSDYRLAPASVRSHGIDGNIRV